MSSDEEFRDISADMATGSQPMSLEQRKKHISVLTGHYTRARKLAEAQVNLVNTAFSEKAATDAEDAGQLLHDKFRGIERECEQLELLDPNNAPGYEKELESLAAELHRITLTIAQQVAAARERHATEHDSDVPPGNAPPMRAAPGKSKPNASLKPDKLTLSHTPSEFRKWMRNFKSYYDSSNFAVEPSYVQRTALDLLLEESLAAAITPALQDDTPLYPTDGAPRSMTEMLEQAFLDAYPLEQRRTEALEMSQRPGESAASFHLRFRSACTEADFAAISTDKLIVFLAIAKSRDKTLRQKLMEINPATYDEMTTASNRLENLYSFKGMSGTGPDMADARAVHQARREGGKGGKGTTSDAQGKPPRASTAHGPKQPTKDMICNFCGIKGHPERKCFKAMREPQTRSVTSESNMQTNKAAEARSARFFNHEPTPSMTL